MPIEFDIVYNDNSRQRIIVQNDNRSQDYVITDLDTQTIVAVEFDPENWLLENNEEVTGPEPPTLLAVYPNAGAPMIHWSASASLISQVQGYRIYESPNGESDWSLLVNESVLTPTTTMYVAPTIAVGVARYYRIHSYNNGQGIASDVYGLRRSAIASNQVVIVDGFDRWDNQAFSNGLNHDLAVTHGRAINGNNVGFETYANDWFGAAVGNNLPSGSSVGAVHWILGNESTVDETFDLNEQNKVSQFLEGGGKLFVSGDEIGWDLGRTSRPIADQNFYRDYLKAAYILDDSEDYSVLGAGDSTVFINDTYNYGSGDIHFFAAFPDVIGSPVGSGAITSLLYSPGVGAGIQYFGTFGSSSLPGGVINIGFSVENISTEQERILFMQRVLDAWGLLTPPPSSVYIHTF
jgi:hypothetical protein